LLHLYEINFLLKKIADIFTYVVFVEPSYSNADNCKFESLQSEESRASDVASKIFLMRQIF